MSGGGGRAPVTHCTCVAVTDDTTHGMPFTTTVVSRPATDSPVPVMVKGVPPRELPNEGLTPVTNGVAGNEYCSKLELPADATVALVSCRGDGGVRRGTEAGPAPKQRG